jgi:hypothetical protein
MAQPLKSAPDLHVAASGLHPPFVHLVVRTLIPLRVGPQTRRCTTMKWVHHNPRGPRSGSGYAGPVRHHLIDPIRPTRGHTAISPRGGLYAMPSLRGSAEATRAWFRAFADCSVLTCRPLRPRGVRHRYASRPAMTTRSSPHPNRLRRLRLFGGAFAMRTALRRSSSCEEMSYRQNSARSKIIGNGMPRIHRSKPRPNPMIASSVRLQSTISICLECVGLDRASLSARLRALSFAASSTSSGWSSIQAIALLALLVARISSSSFS